MIRLSNIEVLRGFEELRSANGMTPTMRELGDYLGVTMATAHRHCNVLISEGLLTRVPLKSRSLALTAAGLTQLAS